MKNVDDVNNFISFLNRNNQKHSLFVDNMHSPYIRLNESYILPGISTLEPEWEAKIEMIKILAHNLPEAISGTSFLPEPRPKKDIFKLFFVRPILFQSRQHLYIFSVTLQYLGGATAEQIQEHSIQGRTPTIETDRIYFETKVIPIESIEFLGQNVIDFKVRPFQESSHFWQAERQPNQSIRRHSEIFDELDFSEKELDLKEKLGITSSVWSLGNIYSPIGIDYFALGHRFLIPSVREVISELRHFDRVLLPSSKGRNPKSLEAYHEFLRRHKMERSLSPSGNILWKIHFTDSREILPLP